MRNFINDILYVGSFQRFEDKRYAIPTSIRFYHISEDISDELEYLLDYAANFSVERIGQRWIIIRYVTSDTMEEAFSYAKAFSSSYVLDTHTNKQLWTN